MAKKRRIVSKGRRMLLDRRFPSCNASPVNVRLFLFIFNFLLLLNCSVIADLPNELDPFLGKLFETVECETFLADASFLAVSTRDCPPSNCDFPRQLCMRPAASYKDKSANQCRAIPEECLLAANGGIAPPPSPGLSTASPPPPPSSLSPPPPPPPAPSTPPPLPPSSPSPLSPSVPPPAPEQLRPDAVMPIFPSSQPSPIFSKVANSIGERRLPFGSICEQDPPEGRFCGFSLKFAFNRETRNCDQFWFPGCRTAQTNDNLFDSLAECVEASQHCSSRAIRPSEGTFGPPLGPPPSVAQPNLISSQAPPPATNNGEPLSSLMGQWQNSQAGQFIRMITNTIREVRERGGNTAGLSQRGATDSGGEGLRWDANQLGGLFRSLGKRK